MVEQVAKKLQPKHICYVDDSRTSAFVTRKMLEKKGFVVTHFVRAEDALEALIEKDFDLLITDLMITTEGDGVNGDDLIRLIRLSGHPKKSHLPIIVVTGTADEGLQQQLITTGANKVLLKPIDEVLLENTINESLEHHTQKTEPQKPVAKEPQHNIKAETLVESDELKQFVKTETVDESIVPKVSEAESTKQTAKQKPKEGLSLKDQLVSHIEKQEAINIPTLTEEVSVKPKPKDSDKEPVINPEISENFDRQAIIPRNSVVNIPLVDDFPEQAPAPHLREEVKENSPINDEITSKKPVENVSELSLQPLAQDLDEQIVIPKFGQRSEPRNEQSVDHPAIDLDDLFSSEDKDEKTKVDEEKIDDGFIEEQFDKLSEFDVDSFFIGEGDEGQVEKKTTKPKKEDTVRFEDLANLKDIEQTPKQSAPKPEKKKVEKTVLEDNPLLSILDQFDSDEPDFTQNNKSGQAFKSPGPSFKLNIPPKVRNWLLVVLAVLITVPPLIYVIFQETLIEVDIVAVQMAPIHEAVSVSGKVVSKKQVEVTSFFPGQLKDVKVKEGSQVKKGDILAELDGREARGRVTKAEATLISVQENVSLSHKSLERLQRALDKGAVSRQMVEDAEAKWKTASARQSLAEQELKDAKLEVERLSIRAPFSGLVTSIETQEGQWLAPPKPLLKLVDMSNIEVELRVDAADSTNLLPGQKVDVSSDAFPGQSWEEEIIRIASTTERDNSNNFVNVYVTLGSHAPKLKVGQQVDASVKIASNNRALVVPFEAIKQINGKTMVAVNLNGRVHYVPVVTGIESFSKVEIVQGLTFGQKVLLPGGLNLEEGQKISIVEQ